MKIAVVGSGGREHALLWRLSRDRESHELLALPGNGGTGAIARNIAANAEDVESLLKIIRSELPDLVVVGPEVPLARGIADRLGEAGIACFGPLAAAARLESSKVFAKRFMAECRIPTAEFEVFSESAQATKFLQSQPEGNGWVVKADGLAAGKGAFVCSSLEEASHWTHELLDNRLLGNAGSQIVLERKLAGREVSALYLCDGNRAWLLPPAQDYKRAFDGDTGPNTGGMGAYSPADHLTPSLQNAVYDDVVLPVLKGMAAQGSPYRGLLYVGLMLTGTGAQVIEFNCRFGDPETQVVMPLLEGEFAATLLQCANGMLPENPPIATSDRFAVCVVLSADGYPGEYQKGITLTDETVSDYSMIFHAGTRRDESGLRSTGGRVLNAIGTGATLQEARDCAYARAKAILVPGLRHRNDIAGIS